MCKRQKISLIGIGMGGRTSITAEAADAVRNCDCMIGAQRMLSAAREVRRGAETKGHSAEATGTGRGKNKPGHPRAV